MIGHYIRFTDFMKTFRYCGDTDIASITETETVYTTNKEYGDMSRLGS